MTSMVRRQALLSSHAYGATHAYSAAPQPTALLFFTVLPMSKPRRMFAKAGRAVRNDVLRHCSRESAAHPRRQHEGAKPTANEVLAEQPATAYSRTTPNKLRKANESIGGAAHNGTLQDHF